MDIQKSSISTSLPVSASSDQPRVSEQQIEAARYAVLRRLSPCLHHHMVRPLQPIGLICGVMQHKLAVELPDLQAVRQDAEKIADFSKAALGECTNITTWMAPETGELMALDAGVRESVGLLATMLHFCGFRLANAIENMPVQVPQGALRMMMNAVLLEVTDTLNEPADLKLSATVQEGEAIVVLQISPHGEGSVDRYDESYRNLVWADVEALAFAEQVGLSREDGQITLAFPIKGTAKAH